MQTQQGFNFPDYLRRFLFSANGPQSLSNHANSQHHSVMCVSLLKLGRGAVWSETQVLKFADNIL